MGELSADTFSPERPASRSRWRLGRLGLMVGVVGLIAAVLGPHVAEALRPPDPPPRALADTLAEAGDKFVGRMLDRVRGRKPVEAPPPPTPIPWDRYFSLAATAIGLVGALLGTAGWIRREEQRVAAGAIVVGSLAVAWTYIVAALVIALVIVILITVFSALAA